MVIEPVQDSYITCMELPPQAMYMWHYHSIECLFEASYHAWKCHLESAVFEHFMRTQSVINLIIVCAAYE